MNCPLRQNTAPPPPSAQRRTGQFRRLPRRSASTLPSGRPGQSRSGGSIPGASGMLHFLMGRGRSQPSDCQMHSCRTALSAHSAPQAPTRQSSQSYSCCAAPRQETNAHRGSSQVRQVPLPRAAETARSAGASHLPHAHRASSSGAAHPRAPHRSGTAPQEHASCILPQSSRAPAKYPDGRGRWMPYHMAHRQIFSRSGDDTSSRQGCRYPSARRSGRCRRTVPAPRTRSSRDRSYRPSPTA